MKKISLTVSMLLFLFSSMLAQNKSSKGQEFLSYFQGTFASTKLLWIKITINGRNVTVWESSGRSGSWGSPRTCVLRESNGQVDIRTDRNDDGSKFYSVETSGCADDQVMEYSINYWPTGGSSKYTYQLALGGAILSKVNANHNPWK